MMYAINTYNPWQSSLIAICGVKSKRMECALYSSEHVGTINGQITDEMFRSVRHRPSPPPPPTPPLVAVLRPLKLHSAIYVNNNLI